MISLIVAHDPERVIGYQNKLPWHIPGDLAYFKEKTMGKAMVMGRNTFESIGKALPGRKSIVVSRNPNYHAEGAVVTTSLVDAVNIAKDHHEEVMVIGGEQIFRTILPQADRLYITFIQKSFKGDTYFPPYSENDWILTEASEEMQTSDGIPYVYLVYDRKVRD